MMYYNEWQEIVVIYEIIKFEEILFLYQIIRNSNDFFSFFWFILIQFSLIVNQERKITYETMLKLNSFLKPTSTDQYY